MVFSQHLASSANDESTCCATACLEQSVLCALYSSLLLPKKMTHVTHLRLFVVVLQAHEKHNHHVVAKGLTPLQLRFELFQLLLSRVARVDNRIDSSLTGGNVVLQISFQSVHFLPQPTLTCIHVHSQPTLTCHNTCLQLCSKLSPGLPLLLAQSVLQFVHLVADFLIAHR